MKDEWREFIQKEMQKEAEKIMEEVNADPMLRDVQCPEEVHDRLFAQIREYEEQKALEQLSEKDRELIQLGKIYKRRRKWSRYAVLIAAAVALFAIGTISMGENESILQIISRYLLGGEQIVSDAGSTEPIQYIDEEEVFDEIENTYGVAPVKLRYLPEKMTFLDAIFCQDIQEINLYYGEKETDIIYIIKPNYRETSYATVIEDTKIQEYVKVVGDTEVLISEYDIKDSMDNRWLVLWVYQDVQYTLNITNMKQLDVEKIVDNLKLFE